MNEIRRMMLEMEAAAKAAGGALTEEQALTYQKQINEQLGLLQKRLSARDVWHADAWFRPNELQLLREYLSRAFYARCRAVRPVYNHLLISAAPENLPSARKFAARIAAAEAEFFGEEQELCVRTLTEEQLLSCSDPDLREALLHELGQARVLLAPEFEALDLPRFETALDGLGIGRYAVILCVTEETAEEIRGYAANDYRLARYCLRHSYHYTDKSAEDAYEYACRRLAEGGLTLTEEFREKLKIYVEAVYPEAVLHGAEFVRDLLIRIEDTRASSLRFSPTLTAADVPYSRKAELLAKDRKTGADGLEPAADDPNGGADLPATPRPEPDEEKKPEEKANPAVGDRGNETRSIGGAPQDPADEAEIISNQDFAKLTLQADNPDGTWKPANVPLDNRPINVLLLAMSTFPFDNNTKREILSRSAFRDQDSSEAVEIYGRGQLDPIPKKLFYDFAREGNRQALDYVIIMRTEAVTKKKKILVEMKDRKYYAIEAVTPIEFFQAQIGNYLNAATLEGQFVIVPPIEDPIKQNVKAAKKGKKTGVTRQSPGQSKSPREERPAETIEQVIHAIQDFAKQSTVGEGKKKVNLYVDIHGGLRDKQMLTQAVISLLDSDNSDVSIQVYTVVTGNGEKKGTITRNDETIQITNFVSGIHEIINYGRTNSLHRYMKTDPAIMSDNARYLVEALDKIAEGIAWCDVKSFQLGLRDLDSKMQEQSDGRSRPDAEEDPRTKTYLQLFRQNIIDAYGGLLKQRDCVPLQVRWCLKKGLYQQALALVESRIPRYLVTKGVFYPGFACSADGASDDDRLETAKEVFDTYCYQLFNTPSRALQCKSMLTQVKERFRRTNFNDADADRFVNEGISWPRPWMESISPCSAEVILEYLEREKYQDKFRNLSNAEPSGREVGFCLRTDHAVELEQVFLVLHKIIKDVRNSAMHAGEFDLGEGSTTIPVNFKTMCHVLEIYLNHIDTMVSLVNND